MYGVYLLSKRVKIWYRMFVILDIFFFWVFGGDWNFVERR